MTTNSTNTSGLTMITNHKAVALQLYKELEAANAELAALRPLAALGERAIREEWYVNGQAGNWHCCTHSVPMYLAGKHMDGCDVPALLAQLEAKPDA